MRRLTTSLTAATVLLLAFAPNALAFNDGRGFYGESDDKVVTTAGFILIGFFALFVFVASLIYNHLDKRRHDRLDAAKHRRASAEWHGGW
jgi:ABC-type nickel/cobalt efflux system permease component RcnA